MSPRAIDLFEVFESLALDLERAGARCNQNSQNEMLILRSIESITVAVPDLENRPQRQNEYQGNIDQRGQDAAGRAGNVDRQRAVGDRDGLAGGCEPAENAAWSRDPVDAVDRGLDLTSAERIIRTGSLANADHPVRVYVQGLPRAVGLLPLPRQRGVTGRGGGSRSGLRGGGRLRDRVRRRRRLHFQSNTTHLPVRNRRWPARSRRDARALDGHAR